MAVSLRSLQPLKDLISSCDNLIRQGQIHQVQQQLQELKVPQIPRTYREPLAKLCRRTGNIKKGLSLLHSIVRDTESLALKPSAKEVCEYAVLLSRNGSINEALTLLKSISPTEESETLLYQGYCHVMLWDYAKAAELFEQFLKMELPAYSRLISQVNLVGAYLSIEQFAKAKELVNEVMESAKSSNSMRIIANCHDLKGQLYCTEGNYNQAYQEFNTALQIFGDSRSLDQLVVYKNIALTKAYESQSIGPIEDFRSEALKRSHWDSVREADLALLKLNFSQLAFEHLLFGSPIEGYRRHILKNFPRPIREFYPLGGENSRGINLLTGEIYSPSQHHSESNDGKEICGTKLHHLLAILANDFYSPQTVGSLFSALYPTEYYNVESSPLRIRQLITRLRRWLEDNEIPAHILQTENSYKFEVTKPFTILVPYNLSPIDNSLTQLERLKALFEVGHSFSAAEACDCLNISRSKFQGIVESGINSGILERLNSGKLTAYAFKALKKVS